MTNPLFPTAAPSFDRTPPNPALVQLKTQLKSVFLQMSLVFSPIINLLTLTSSLYMMQVYDRVLTSHSVSTLVYLTLIAIGALALMAALEFVRGRILSRLGTWIEQKLAAESLQRAVDAVLAGTPYRGEVLRDLATIRSFFSTPSLGGLMDLPWMPVFLLALFALHPSMGWLAIAGAVALFGLAVLNDKLTHKGLKESTASSMKAMRGAEQAIRNAEVIDVLGMMPGLLYRWRSLSDEAMAVQQKAIDQSGTVVGVSRFVRFALQIFVLALGAHLALNREMTGGAMIAASIIMARALAPIEGMIAGWRGTLNAFEAYKRLETAFAKPLLHASPMDLPKPKGHLTAEAITYIIPGQKFPVLKGVSFEVRQGQVAAIVGPSAAGKSTLMRLCVGAYAPTYGHVRLDGADLAQWNRTSLSQHLGYLPQDVELFAGTVRENIARLLPATSEEIVEAAQLAGAHEMILRLPNGYDTEIGDGGAFLSGGQRQRLGLARALLRSPQLVVLDEPNSSLDAEGEEALSQAIARLKTRGTTVLLVGHRPSILANADIIIVLKDGRVEAAGPKAEILPRIMPKPPAAPAKPAEVTKAAPPSSETKAST